MSLCASGISSWFRNCAVPSVKTKIWRIQILRFPEDLRAQVHRLLEQGMTDREIKDYLKSRYSEFILYRPEVNQNTWLLWAAPVVFLLFGLWVLYRLYFNRPSSDTSVEQNDQLSSVDQQRLDQLLRNKDKQ
jgi:cytochrome c-type biogenesis protein CcmH